MSEIFKIMCFASVFDFCGSFCMLNFLKNTKRTFFLLLLKILRNVYVTSISFYRVPFKSPSTFF